jgi:hypothetical protein
MVSVQNVSVKDRGQGLAPTGIAVPHRRQRLILQAQDEPVRLGQHEEEADDDGSGGAIQDFQGSDFVRKGPLCPLGVLSASLLCRNVHVSDRDVGGISADHERLWDGHDHCQLLSEKGRQGRARSERE